MFNLSPSVAHKTMLELGKAQSLVPLKKRGKETEF